MTETFTEPQPHKDSRHKQSHHLEIVDTFLNRDPFISPTLNPAEMTSSTTSPESLEVAYEKLEERLRRLEGRLAIASAEGTAPKTLLDNLRQSPSEALVPEPLRPEDTDEAYLRHQDKVAMAMSDESRVGLKGFEPQWSDPRDMWFNPDGLYKSVHRMEWGKPTKPSEEEPKRT